MALDDTLVARALETQGLSYGDPVTRVDYRDHLFWWDTPKNRDAFARTMSSCLVHVRGILGRDEVDGRISWGNGIIDCLRTPYANFVSHIETLLLALARQRNLLVTHQDQAAIRSILRPGGMVVHGAYGSLPPPGPERTKHLSFWGGVAHGIFITGIEGNLVESVDGGQIDPLNLDPKTGQPRCTKITRCVREIRQRSNGLWLGERKLNWGFDLGRLPVR